MSDAKPEQFLSNKQARQLVLHLQGLTGKPHIKQTPDALYDLIVQLGFVQVDSIQWMERAHHMTLFARNQTYRPSHLKKLIEKDRKLFEHWTHDASIVPCCFYPYWRHRMVRKEASLRQQFIKWQGSGFLDHCDRLMETIENSGPIRSRDLERPKSDGPNEMWQWHDGKAALEYLWVSGKLAIKARQGFQKVYDLCHLAVPEDHFNTEVCEVEFIDWACRSAIQRLGFGSATDIARYWNHLSIEEVKNWLAGPGANKVCCVRVQTKDGTADRRVYGRIDIEDLIGIEHDMPTRLKIGRASCRERV